MMKLSCSNARLPRVTLLGMIWVWSVLGLLGLVCTIKPELPGGWGLAVFACIMIGVFLSGLALLVSLISRPWTATRGQKPTGQGYRSITLWDREIDG